MARTTVAAAERVLERLGHHDLLDAAEDDPLRQALGARSLARFRALHAPELERLLESLPAKGADAAALRGRLLRLLGDDDGARRALRTAAGAKAAGWLGESWLSRDPRKALAPLARAEALDPSWPWPRLWKAAALLRLGRARAARAELEAFGRLAPKTPFVARLLRAQAALHDRDLRGALREAEAAIKADPASPAGYEAAARALQAQGRASAAVARAHDARDLDFDVTGAFLYENSGLELDWKKPAAFLLARLDRAIAARPRLAALYAERAEFLRLPAVCRYDEALADYAKAVELEPRRAWLRAVLGRARNNLSGGEAGLSDFDRAARLAPRCGWSRAWRGALLARLGRGREALADFAAAERLMPWHSFTYAWRGALRNRRGEFAAARRDLDTALRLDPTYMFSVYERFRALRGLGEYEAALRDLNAAFAADPKYCWDGGDAELDAAVKSHPRLGWLFAWRGRRRLERGLAREALADFDRALARERGDARILSWRGRARHAAGRTAPALRDLAEAVRRSPSSWDARQALAEVHEARGDKRRALAEITRAAALAPTTVSFLLTKGRLELELGRHAAALATTERALQLDASSAGARSLKGRVLLTRGMARDARGRIADFRRALDLAPELFAPEERLAVSRLTGANA